MQVKTKPTKERILDRIYKSVSTIRAGLQQGVFPWGYAIETSEGRWSYIINRPRFEEIEGLKLGD